VSIKIQSACRNKPYQRLLKEKVQQLCFSKSNCKMEEGRAERDLGGKDTRPAQEVCLVRRNVGKNSPDYEQEELRSGPELPDLCESWVKDQHVTCYGG
jgi:hypothetical protein